MGSFETDDLCVGNFSRECGAKFLKGFSDVLRSEDSMLVGLDATSDPSKV